jgi:hypothetical protein
MKRLRKMAEVAAAIGALLLVVPASEAQVDKQQSAEFGYQNEPPSDQ